MSSILKSAEEVVYGDRLKDYGDPKENHSTTAVLWTAFLARRIASIKGVPVRLVEDVLAGAIDASCVSEFNILQKMSRQAHRRKLDNLVDIAGYAANIEICESTRSKT